MLSSPQNRAVPSGYHVHVFKVPEGLCGSLRPALASVANSHTEALAPSRDEFAPRFGVHAGSSERKTGYNSRSLFFLS